MASCITSANDTVLLVAGNAAGTVVAGTAAGSVASTAAGTSVAGTVVAGTAAGSALVIYRAIAAFRTSTAGAVMLEGPHVPAFSTGPSRVLEGPHVPAFSTGPSGGRGAGTASIQCRTASGPFRVHSARRFHLWQASRAAPGLR